MLHEALVRQEFLLHYQPYLDLTTHQVAGVEALIRWQHPLRGLLYPDDFILHAERSGLINSIGEWVLNQACAQMSEWIALGIDIPSMSVNVSPCQFSNCSLPTLVQTILQKKYAVGSILGSRDYRINRALRRKNDVHEHCSTQAARRQNFNRRLWDGVFELRKTQDDTGRSPKD